MGEEMKLEKGSVLARGRSPLTPPHPPFPLRTSAPPRPSSHPPPTPPPVPSAPVPAAVGRMVAIPGAHPHGARLPAPRRRPVPPAHQRHAHAGSLLDDHRKQRPRLDRCVPVQVHGWMGGRRHLPARAPGLKLGSLASWRIQRRPDDGRCDVMSPLTMPSLLSVHRTRAAS